MKLTRTCAESIIQVLKNVLINNRYADKSLETVFRETKNLTADDRAIIAETSYDIIRYYRLLQESSKSQSLWKLLGAWLILNNNPISDWKEFSGLNAEAIRNQHEEAKKKRSVRESIPEWLDEWGERELGSQWEHEIKALNAIPSPYLRTNTLKLSREDLQVRLRDEGIETEMVNGFTDALKVNHYVNLFKSQSFQEGLFEVQDAGSQCIAPFLQVEPGMRVIDACAGTGGKSLHLATLMKNKGRLISMDVAEWKLEEFKMRARRAGVHNFETKVIESAKTIKRHHNSADRLLLDVPCSGLGVLKRNPDAKWKLKPDYINRLLVVQQQILSDYAWMIKPGGMLVYSTCSVLPSENANQVTTFLSKNSDYFELVEEKSLLPSAGLDGFYMARIKRIG